MSKLQLSDLLMTVDGGVVGRLYAVLQASKADGKQIIGERSVIHVRTPHSDETYQVRRAGEEGRRRTDMNRDCGEHLTKAIINGFSDESAPATARKPSTINSTLTRSTGGVTTTIHAEELDTNRSETLSASTHSDLSDESDTGRQSASRHDTNQQRLPEIYTLQLDATLCTTAEKASILSLMLDAKEDIDMILTERAELHDDDLGEEGLEGWTTIDRGDY